MKWWMMVTIGAVWCVICVLLAVLSFEGAIQAVADGLATSFGPGEIAAGALSATIFSIPGIGFLIFGVRKLRRGY